MPEAVVKKLPASIRNKNPGAMFPGPSAKLFGSTSYQNLKTSDGNFKIATFDSHEQGAAALFHLLSTKRYCDKPLSEAIKTWCGGLYADTYLSVIRKKSGIAANEVITHEQLHNPEWAIPLAQAMAWQEAGRAYPMSEGAWAAAHAMFIDVLPAPAAAPRARREEAPPAKTPAVDVNDKADGDAWSPSNDLPSPRPEARVDAELAGSRKWSLLSVKRRILTSLFISTGGMAVTEDMNVAPAFLTKFKEFAADNAVLLILGGVVVGLVLVEAVRFLQREDMIEGRYQPKDTA